MTVSAVLLLCSKVSLVDTILFHRRRKSVIVDLSAVNPATVGDNSLIAACPTVLRQQKRPLINILTIESSTRADLQALPAQITVMAHQADATRMLDDRGYTGVLIRGANPLLLFEKAVRDRIIDSYYWKEQCFGLNAATLLDRAVDLTFLGGTYGGAQKPTPFLCLAFKMLQLTPEKEIVLAYLRQDDWKYLRALAMFYIRLTWEPKEVHETLEEYLADYRKLKRRTREGFALTFVDQFVDDLLNKDRVCATSLWKMPTRAQLEDADLLEPRVSPLGEEIENLDDEREDEGVDDGDEGEVEEVTNGNGHRSDEHMIRNERSASPEDPE